MPRVKVSKETNRYDPLAVFEVTSDGKTKSNTYDIINAFSHGLNKKYVDIRAISKKVHESVIPNMSLSQTLELAAETAATMITKHPDHDVLASRIAISKLHRETKETFFSVVKDLYRFVDPRTGQHSPLVSDELYETVMKHADKLDKAINYRCDFEYSYFGFKTLERSYLLRIDGKVKERPQHMLMRVAIGIHGKDIDAAIETYNLMSEKYFTHASPTLFNAGTQSRNYRRVSCSP